MVLPDVYAVKYPRQGSLGPYGGGLKEVQAVQQGAALALQRRFVPAQPRPLRPPA